MKMNKKETMLLIELAMLAIIINKTINEISVDLAINDYVSKIESKIYNSSELNNRRPPINFQHSYQDVDRHWKNKATENGNERLEIAIKELKHILTNNKIDYSEYYAQYESIISNYELI